MFKVNKIGNKGQSSLEIILVLGFIVIPSLSIGFKWINTEWSKSECAFQDFKLARMTMIRTQKPASANGITLRALEDLDQNKGGLVVSDLLREVSQLWEQLSSSSHSWSAPDQSPFFIKLEIK